MVTTGSGLTGTVTVNTSPLQLNALTGTTVYTTLTSPVEILVKASLAKSETANPFTTAAPPAETERPFKFKPVTL